jgi:hypothetical protein
MGDLRLSRHSDSTELSPDPPSKSDAKKPRHVDSSNWLKSPGTNSTASPSLRLARRISIFQFFWTAKRPETPARKAYLTSGARGTDDCQGERGVRMTADECLTDRFLGEPCPATEFYLRFGLGEVDFLSSYGAFPRLLAVQAVPRRNARTELRALFKSDPSNFKGPHNLFIAFDCSTISEKSIPPHLPLQKISSPVTRSSSD